MASKTKVLVKGKIGYKITLETTGERNLDKRMFGNSLGFTSLEIIVKDEIPLFRRGVGPKLSHFLPHGIVISCDSCQLGDEGNDGVHNFLIPWSQVIYMKQYIAVE